MFLFSATLLAVIVCSLHVDLVPAAGQLRILTFPVGQGDAQVIECPDGLLTVVDLGSCDGVKQKEKLREYFSGKYDKIQNIVITHNHGDHYNLFPSVLSGADGMTSLRNIYISKTKYDLPPILENWINDIVGSDKIHVFNDGKQCGFSGGACDDLDLCPNNKEIVAKVLSVNAGKQCSPVHENTNSIVFSVNYTGITVHMNGDFEDCSSSEGAQLQMVKHYGRELETTVYKLAHHGASNLANKKVMRDAVKPKAIVVSGNPYFRYHHPRCGIIDAFINDVGTLCDPAAPQSCGPNPFAVQTVYTCGGETKVTTVTDNKLAIFTTIPDEKSTNDIEFVTDGTNWSFIIHETHFPARLTSDDNHASGSEPADCNVLDMNNGYRPGSTVSLLAMAVLITLTV